MGGKTFSYHKKANLVFLDVETFNCTKANFIDTLKIIKIFHLLSIST